MRKQHKYAGNRMPHGAGLYFYTPGYWPPAEVAQAVNRRFVRQGAVVRVLVEDSPSSGRHCKRLRMGGSAAMPGYTGWRGKWVRCAEQALEPTRTLVTDAPTGQRQAPHIVPHQDYAYLYPNTM